MRALKREDAGRLNDMVIGIYYIAYNQVDTELFHEIVVGLW